MWLWRTSDGAPKSLAFCEHKGVLSIFFIYESVTEEDVGLAAAEAFTWGATA